MTPWYQPQWSATALSFGTNEEPLVAREHFAHPPHGRPAADVPMAFYVASFRRDVRRAHASRPRVEIHFAKLAQESVHDLLMRDAQRIAVRVQRVKVAKGGPAP